MTLASNANFAINGGALLLELDDQRLGRVYQERVRRFDVVRAPTR